MKVLVFGATGGTGQQLVEQALQRGHTVTAFARVPAAISIHHQRLSIVQGDALDSARVESAVAGHDAVLSALGARALFKRNQSIQTELARNIVAAMKKQGVRRFIYESAYGVGYSPANLAFGHRVVMRLLLKNIYADKVGAERLIRDSGSDWVIVHPPQLTNGPRTGKYEIGTDMRLPFGAKISRADVADFMLNMLTDDTYLRNTVVVAY
jgi:putative NADH-flavin reductase